MCKLHWQTGMQYSRTQSHIYPSGQNTRGQNGGHRPFYNIDYVSQNNLWTQCLSKAPLSTMWMEPLMKPATSLKSLISWSSMRSLRMSHLPCHGICRMSIILGIHGWWNTPRELLGSGKSVWPDAPHLVGQMHIRSDEPADSWIGLLISWSPQNQIVLEGTPWRGLRWPVWTWRDQTASGFVWHRPRWDELRWQLFMHSSTEDQKKSEPIKPSHRTLQRWQGYSFNMLWGIVPKAIQEFKDILSKEPLTSSQIWEMGPCHELIHDAQTFRTKVYPGSGWWKQLDEFLNLKTSKPTHMPT